MLKPVREFDPIDHCSGCANPPSTTRVAAPRSRIFEAGLLAVSALLLLSWTAILGWFVFELISWFAS
ncbi:MAG: hypothetical protein JWM36_1594 [Hyphomicrobiales bacterium]|nr:hypothetical protein [Hyphomicrobiales bacterium]